MDLPDDFGIHGHVLILRMLIPRCMPVLCCTSLAPGDFSTCLPGCLGAVRNATAIGARAGDPTRAPPRGLMPLPGLGRADL